MIFGELDWSLWGFRFILILFLAAMLHGFTRIYAGSKAVVPAWRPALLREYPDCAALRHFRILAWEDAVERALHPARVSAPACLYCDVLLSVYCER